jgi:hypothetical protein
MNCAAFRDAQPHLMARRLLDKSRTTASANVQAFATPFFIVLRQPGDRIVEPRDQNGAALAGGGDWDSHHSCNRSHQAGARAALSNQVSGVT